MGLGRPLVDHLQPKINLIGDSYIKDFLSTAPIFSNLHGSPINTFGAKAANSDYTLARWPTTITSDGVSRPLRGLGAPIQHYAVNSAKPMGELNHSLPVWGLAENDLIRSVQRGRSAPYNSEFPPLIKSRGLDWASFIMSRNFRPRVSERRHYWFAENLGGMLNKYPYLNSANQQRISELRGVTNRYQYEDRQAVRG